MSTIDIPQPTTGPTAKLAWNDPATLIMILTWFGEAAKALSDQLGQGHASLGGVLTAIATTAITLGVVISKHVYSGKLANAIPPVVTALGQVGPLTFDPQVVAQLQAGVAALQARFDALPDQTQAVRDALANLLGVSPPASSPSPSPTPVVDPAVTGVAP
jgi:hypothetical protein